MSLSINLPTKELPVSTEESKWFAAHNPLVITQQRVDYQLQFTTDNGAGFTDINTVDPMTETMKVGDYIYFESGGLKGVYRVIVVIDNQTFTIDLPFTVTTTGGFVNLNSGRPYYRSKMEFSRYDVSINNFKIYELAYFTPSSSGLIQADISEYVKKNVKAIDEYDFSTANAKDTNLSSQVAIKFTEEWTGYSGLVDIVPFKVVNAAMQNGNVGGSNMALFVTEPSGQDKAEWMSEFTRPTYWVGLPFDLQFIFSELANSLGALRVVELITNENGSTSTSPHTLNESLFGWVNRMKMPTPTYSAQAVKTDIKIDDNGGHVLTKTITVDIIQCLPKNPVYLKWLGGKGGWNYWCFSGNQVEGIESKNGNTFEAFKPDLELKRDSGKLISKSSIPTMTLGVQGLTTEKKDGLKTLLESVQVELFTGYDDDDVPTWKTVIVDGYQFKANTKSSRHSLELTIKFPKINTQTQ